MSTVTQAARPVQPGLIPTDSDRRIHPELIPVAAFLCVEEYDDAARARVLERLADGVSPRDCARDGALEWRDVLAVEELLARRRPALVAAGRLSVAPIRGGAPVPPPAPPAPPARELCDPYRDGFGPDDFMPRPKSDADRAADRADVMEWYREHAE